MDNCLFLRWKNHSNVLLKNLNLTKSQENYSDAVLVCQDKYFYVHRIILSICSKYFQEIFQTVPSQNPVIILKDIHPEVMQLLLSYMYVGEMSTFEKDLPKIIEAAEALKVKGLSTLGDTLLGQDLQNFKNELVTKEDEEKPESITQVNEDLGNDDVDSNETEVPISQGISENLDTLMNSDFRPVPTNVERVEANVLFDKSEVFCGFEASHIDAASDQITTNETVTSSLCSKQPFPEMDCEDIPRKMYGLPQTSSVTRRLFPEMQFEDITKERDDTPQTSSGTNRPSTRAVAKSNENKVPQTSKKPRRTRSTPNFYDEYNDSIPALLKIALQQSLKTQSESKRRIIKCKECSFRTYLRLKMKNHELENHLSSIENIEPKCKYCFMTFATNYSLQRHLLRKHEK